MSTVRALDINHDWTWGLGANNYLQGNAAVAQNIQTSVLSFLGDCFFAPSDGIDWWNLLGKAIDGGITLQLAVNAVILSVADVQMITSSSVNLNRATRTLTLGYIVQTTYSQTSGTLTYAFPTVS